MWEPIVVMHSLHNDSNFDNDMQAVTVMCMV